MSLIGSRKSGISARLVEASARAVVVMAHQDTGGLLRRPCAWLAPALGSAMATHRAVHAASANAPLTIVGVTADPLAIAPVQLITPGYSIVGHASGTSRDIEETMHFAVL